MNIEDNLILIKGEDSTEQITECKYQYSKCWIRFKNGKLYSYNQYNVQWFRNPIIMDPATPLACIEELLLTDVQKIFDFGEHIRVCFQTGIHKVYHKKNIVFEQSTPSRHVTLDTFSYLKKVAGKLSISGEDDSFLLDQYDKITTLDTSTVLYKYLSQEKFELTKESQFPIFPFGFNISQEAATNRALTEQISVIEGPPGTGKTQTILNIIANSIINNKTVAVVSSNNAATSNVLEKLKEYEIDFIAAFLGNKENKKKFFSNQTCRYPDMSTWQKSTEEYRYIQGELRTRGHKLKEMLEAKNELAIYIKRAICFAN